MDSSRSKPSFTSLVAFGFILLPFAYVLSYAPVVRVTGHSPLKQELSDYYGPVDWMLDLTPLYEPYLKWAALWGVEEEFDANQLVLRAYHVKNVDLLHVMELLSIAHTHAVVNAEGPSEDIFLYTTPNEHRQVTELFESHGVDVRSE